MELRSSRLVCLYLNQYILPFRKEPVPKNHEATPWYYLAKISQANFAGELGFTFLQFF